MRMKDIAEQLNLSIATISRVVNGHPNVNEETKKKVLEFIEKKGYTPNVIAQNLSKMENKTIALLVPNISNSFFASLTNFICKYFSKSGYQIALYNTVENVEVEEKAVKNILGHRIAGVIAILIKGEYENNPLVPLIKQGIPVYLLDRDFENSSFPGVFMDNFTGAYNITKELLDRGHKDIAIMTGDLNFLNARERLKGYIQAHKDMKLDYSLSNVYEGDYLFYSGYKLGKKILKSKCTALFSSNNLMMYGFLKAQKENKKNIELACFDDIEYQDILDTEILSCKVSLEEMGKEIYRIFTEDEKTKIYIEPKLDLKGRQQYEKSSSNRKH